MLKSFLITAWCAVAVTISNSATLTILAPYYGHYLSSQVLPSAHLIASITLLLFSWIWRIFSKRYNHHYLIALTPAVIVSIPSFASETAAFSGNLGPHVGPVVSGLPAILATSFVLVWISSKYGLVQSGLFVLLIAKAGPHITSWIHSTIPMLSCFAISIAAIMMAIVMVSTYSSADSSARPSSRIGSMKVISLLVVIPLAVGLYANNMSGSIRQCSHSQLSNREPDGKIADYQVLARRESVTGYVAVVNSPTEFGTIRLLRCDHSILGGVYLQYDHDSIFGSFYILDFVRFIKRDVPNSGDNVLSALQLGLGVGITASTLTRVGVVVDVVELDPAVYEYAREYFNLPLPNRVHIGDGRVFIDDLATENSYDYVLHDVFTGGIVPGTLFSVEAITAVNRILKPNGILALNYVGRLDTNATSAVLKTIKAVFPFIQGYVESNAAMEKNASGDLYNMVFFASHAPIEFSDPAEKDLQVGGVYADMLRSFKNLRIDDAMLDSHHSIEVITDLYNPLAQLQVESAYQHWKVMRQLFPSEFWALLF
ncbi:hypothetical protein BASA50_001662 [Batrachochytrium salamandrivorans]|uniref:PABS domain-containing protein n=1 Tax=Batrachochytrium salamandrivorans TaxID=1357716 RepID=A0ABQ8FRK6_9FUNG|nr:hypothetical protein BASA50_001662 [Batrachochytrium salamandrivorans]KAH9266058.1 hypothetical protein BASA83_010795 [Batrachochytrium salamandrivorans]KAJ1332220.1 hypothetical protein BSLG_008882 [Batrachochytrium salamandrivorans]